MQVIRMLTKMTEYGHKIKEEMKAIQSEIKEMYREPTVKGRKPDSNQRFGTKGINTYPNGRE